MKRSEEELNQQLQQWYRQSRQQNAMPVVVKQQLKAQIAATSVSGSGWQRLAQSLIQLWSWRNVQALTAVFALALGWQLLQQDQFYYQISQNNAPYPVQVHQLIPLHPEKIPGEQYNVRAGQRQALYTEKYQDYLKASQNSQNRRQLIVSRQFSQDGWHLDLCRQMQLQLTSAWLHQFKLQQHWTEPQWQQLQQSDWLQVTTGEKGQILALQRSEHPPACAP